MSTGSLNPWHDPKSVTQCNRHDGCYVMRSRPKTRNATSFYVSRIGAAMIASIRDTLPTHDVDQWDRIWAKLLSPPADPDAPQHETTPHDEDDEPDQEGS